METVLQQLNGLHQNIINLRHEINIEHKRMNALYNFYDAQLELMELHLTDAKNNIIKGLEEA